MVVADDEIYAERGSVLHLIHGFDAAVKGDDECTTFRFRGVNAFGGNTVAFGIAIGDVIDEIIGLRAEERIHEGNGSSAIYIVIAVHHDSLMGIDGLTETIDRYSHVAHEKRIMQTVQRRTYIRSCFRSCADASIRENTSGYRTDFQFGTETFCRRLFFRRPFFYVPINIHFLDRFADRVQIATLTEYRLIYYKTNDQRLSTNDFYLIFVRFFPLWKDFAEMPQFLDGQVHNTRAGFVVVESCEILEPSVIGSGVTVVIELESICADHVDADAVAVVFCGSCCQQRIPILDADRGPAGYADEDVVQVVLVLPQPNGEP